MKKSFTNIELSHTIVFDYSDTEGTPIAVSFYAYAIFGVICGGDEPDTYIYDSSDELLSVDEVTPFAQGYVKWDGCMEISIRQHICGWNRDLEYLMRDIYLQTADILRGGNISGLSALKQHYNITS